MGIWMVKVKILSTGEIKELTLYRGVYVERFHPNGVPDISYSGDKVEVIPVPEPEPEPKPPEYIIGHNGRKFLTKEMSDYVLANIDVDTFYSVSLDTSTWMDVSAPNGGSKSITPFPMRFRWTYDSLSNYYKFDEYQKEVEDTEIKEFQEAYDEFAKGVKWRGTLYAEDNKLMVNLKNVKGVEVKAYKEVIEPKKELPSELVKILSDVLSGEDEIDERRRLS
jgi:hypothetical protein